MQLLECASCCVPGTVTSQHVRSMDVREVARIRSTCDLKIGSNYRLDQVDSLSGVHLRITFVDVSIIIRNTGRVSLGEIYSLWLSFLTEARGSGEK